MASSLLFCTRCGTAKQQQASFCFSCGSPLQHSDGDEQNVNNPSPGATLASKHLLKDRYHILSRLGEGGMGAVYKARDTLFNNRLVAVKEMSQSGLNAQQRTGAADDFKREAHMLADLHHSGLPTTYDYFSDAGQWYLVMDFIAGNTLEEHLADNNGWLPIKQTLSIGKQLCQVLDYLHTRQPPIIFRDLKPANVMYTANGQVFLIDFGIARHFKPGQLKDTVSFGSAGYAAPEQYGKTQTTPRSDIYSPGVILHQCLTGNDPANNSPTPFDFPPLDLHSQPAPTSLAPLTTQMLAMNPSNRPASMSNVLLTLKRIDSELTRLEQASTPAPTVAAQPKPAAPAQQAKPPAPTPKPARPLPPRIPDRLTPAPGQTAPVATPSSPPSRVYSAIPKRVAPPKTTIYSTHYNQAGSVQALCWSPNGNRLVLGDGSGAVQIWDAGLTHPISTYRSHGNVVRALAWSPDDQRFISSSADKIVYLWLAREN